ncbi:MAG: hypothetical protein KY466_10095 [Gemmatimonadetes bacterium]|nr:hypothetical protein [Gemmatimonadota bacterium]
MPLDFRRAADLFTASDEELATALRIDVGTLRQHRAHPGRAPESLLLRLAEILIERGRGMVRVGEMLREEAGGTNGNAPGRS